MRFHVLGIGSVGTLISHHLRKSSPTSPISLIVRKAQNVPHPLTPHHGQSSQGSLAVTRSDHKSISTGFDIEKTHSHTEPITAARYASPEPPNERIDSLIVCLKTYATIPALRRLAPRIGPSSVITLLQNGMGTYDRLCAEVFPDPEKRPFFVLGTTTHGVAMLSKSESVSGSESGSGSEETGGVDNFTRHVMHNTRPGQGEVNFGIVPDPRHQIELEQWIYGYNAGREPILTPPPTPSLPIPAPPPPSTTTTVAIDNLRSTITALLSMTDLSPGLYPMPHLQHQLLMKLAMNCAINPLTAILGLGSLTNGSLISTTSGKTIMRHILSEVSTVLTAYIHSLHAPSPAPADVIRLFQRPSLLRRCIDVAYQTSNNHSSMACDIAAGRPAEIDEINGYIVSLAARLGLTAPINKMMVDMVKFISSVSGLDDNVPKHYRLSLFGKRSVLTLASQVTAEEKRSELEEKKLKLKERELLVREDEVRLNLLGKRERKREGQRERDKRERHWFTAIVDKKLAEGLSDEEILMRGLGEKGVKRLLDFRRRKMQSGATDAKRAASEGTLGGLTTAGRIGGLEDADHKEMGKGAAKATA